MCRGVERLSGVRGWMMQTAALLLLLLLLSLVIAETNASTASLRHRFRQRNTEEPRPLHPRTSQHTADWLRLVRLGYEGGAAARALDLEGGDVHRASIRLSRGETGFHGLHCLKKGQCFGDQRLAVFREPEATSVPVRPPPLQQLPPLTEEEAARLNSKKALATAAKPKKEKAGHGIDFSEDLLPKLQPFAPIHPRPQAVDHAREQSEVRRDMGPTAQQDAFTHLMRKWLTTIESPFFTRKPGSVHESDIHKVEMPEDTHPDMVPARHVHQKKPKPAIKVEYYEPATYDSRTLDELAAQQALKDKWRREDEDVARRTAAARARMAAEREAAKQHWEEYEEAAQEMADGRDQLNV